MSRFWVPKRPKPDKSIKPDKPDMIFNIMLKTRLEFLEAVAIAIVEKFPDLMESKSLHNFWERRSAAEKEIEGGKDEKVAQKT